MINLLRLFAAILLIFGVASFVSPVGAQEGSAEFPSLKPSEIYLKNPTSGKVIFYLETAGTDRREWALEAGEAATFTGADGDTWFNVEIFSGGTSRKYGVDVGGRFYFSWNGNNLELRSI